MLKFKRVEIHVVGPIFDDFCSVFLVAGVLLFTFLRVYRALVIISSDKDVNKC